MKIVFKYFLSINVFNITYSTLLGILFSPISIPLCFGTFGTFVGYLSFNYYFKNQYYFYYNLGLTKKRLITQVWIINIFLSIITSYLLNYE